MPLLHYQHTLHPKQTYHIMYCPAASYCGPYYDYGQSLGRNYLAHGRGHASSMRISHSICPVHEFNLLMCFWQVDGMER